MRMVTSAFSWLTSTGGIAMHLVSTSLVASVTVARLGLEKLPVASFAKRLDDKWR
jgi:hypothetical protein